MKRRTFLKGALGAGFLPFMDGCSTVSDAGRSKGHACPYWCTWDTQARTLRNHVVTGELNLPGGQGVPGVRDTMNEDMLFDTKGWTKLFPSFRGDLMFMIDDGWDVPYGVKGGQTGIHSFESLIPDRERFPSLRDGTGGDRIFARDLLGGKPVDITVLCRREAGRIVLPGNGFAKVGTSMNPSGGDSAPATEVFCS